MIFLNSWSLRSLDAFGNKAHLAQLVGADEAEHNIVGAHAFLEGLCAECLEEHEANKAITLEDIAHTEEEALNLVSGSALSQGRQRCSPLDLRRIAAPALRSDSPEPSSLALTD